MAGTDGFGISIKDGSAAAIASILTIEVPGVSRGDIDVTTHSSTDGWKEKLPQSIQEQPEVTMTLLFLETQEATFRTKILAAAEKWTITDADGNKWESSGFIREFGHDAVLIDDCIKMSVTFRFTGTPTFTPIA